jgi:hypothetical protein
VQHRAEWASGVGILSPPGRLGQAGRAGCGMGGTNPWGVTWAVLERALVRIADRPNSQVPGPQGIWMGQAVCGPPRLLI